MSAQRPVPSAGPASRSTGALIAALVAGMAIGAVAMWWFAVLTSSSRFHRAARAASPDGSRVAVAFERQCDQLVCGELRVGLATAETSAKAMIDTYRDSSCDEIVWTPDGRRIGFLMTGQQLVLYDAQTLKHLGNVRLLTQEAAATRRARGVTFSENGRAVTFDDCPRSHSGCRAGVVGIPQ
jgi:hypothetical protein